MNYLMTLLDNIIYLLFPIAIYLLYLISKKNVNEEENSICLELAIYSSLYLLLRKGIFLDDYMSLVLLNLPLLTSYLKKSTTAAIIISFVLTWYLTVILGYPFVFIVTEYILYFIAYSYFSYKKPTPESILSIFILIKTFTLSIETYLFISPEKDFFLNALNLLVISGILYVAAYLVLYFIKKGEELVNLNSIRYQLEKERHLRSSLFQITHEIKNPIAVCKGYLDMMDVKDEKKLRKYLPIIQEEIARTLTLMDDFLSYSKLKITKEEVDIYLLIDEVLAALKPLFKKNHIVIRSHLPDDEFYLEVDYSRIKQVLVNLLKNAMEAKKEDSMEIKIKTKVEKEHFEIQIIDNGEGMSEETMKKVDEMFYTTKPKGSGLGVSLSKEIMRLHGGDLYYESKIKKGTTAFLVFPVAEQ